MNRVAAYLNRYIDGVAYSAPNILEHYATDRSVLKYHPRIVAVPANTQDLCRLLRFSFQLSKKNIVLPVTVRGGGNSKTGAAIGNGLVISTERLNRIQEVDLRQRLVRVQAGVTYAQLREALRTHGMDLPISADGSETIGGIIARGAKCSLNAKAMDISEVVQQLELVLYDGSVIESRDINLSKVDKKNDLKATEITVYKTLNTVLPSAPKKKPQRPTGSTIDHAGLYGLKGLDAQHFNLIPLVCGSEGSIGVVSEVILQCEAIYDTPNYVAALCRTADKYLQFVDLLKELAFTEIKVYDTEIFNAKDSTGKDTSFFRSADDNGFLVVACAKDDSKRLRRQKLRKLSKRMPSSLRLIQSTPDNISEFTTLDEKLNAYLNDSGATQHLPLFDDVFIPRPSQRDYFNGLNFLAAKHKLQLAVFGNVDHNLFSIRPSFNLADANDRRKLILFTREYFALINMVHGKVCGNASDGRYIAMFANGQRDAKQLALEADVKQIFDPAGILNPGIKHQVDARAVFKHFRNSYNTGLSSRD